MSSRTAVSSALSVFGYAMDAPPTVAPLCRMGVDENLTWAAAGVAMRPATATARMPGCFMKHSPTGRKQLLCAPRRELSIRGMASEKLDGALPNGSRLSCGASARGRKHPALRYELVGAQTHASSESRPRQLQALVRPPRLRITSASRESTHPLREKR